MKPELRAHCLRVLEHYRQRDMRRPATLGRYLAAVRARLARFGIVRTPSDPVQFLVFCQELGLFKTPRKLRHNPKKAS